MQILTKMNPKLLALSIGVLLIASNAITYYLNKPLSTTQQREAQLNESSKSGGIGGGYYSEEAIAERMKKYRETGESGNARF